MADTVPPSKLAALAAYPWVVATVVVGVAGLLAAAAGVEPVARWTITSFAAVVAARGAWAAIRSLLHRSWGLDVLAVTAIVATLAVGDYWAALVIVLMLTGGEALEDFAARRARNALTALLSSTPRFAHTIDAEGVVSEVEIDDVVVGDVLTVKPGETVPVDAELLSTAATLDESALTGESLPVPHGRGDRLLSGAVNGASPIEVRALAIARDSELQQIVSLVEAASNSKAPFVRLADAYAVPFTAVAFAIAGAAWAASGDAVRFAEVLVVATPCPLLIAAPVAFIGGMNRAARMGVIVRSGGAIEQLATVRTVAFDKTGTLTYGAPEVERVDARPGAATAPAQLVSFVAAVEASSGHVLANAIVAEALRLGLTPPEAVDVVEVPGKGLRAVVAGHRIAVGRLDFVDDAPPDEAWTPAPLESGQMAVYASVDGRAEGRLVLRDRVRDNARETVAALRLLGVSDASMLTGDGPQTAAHVARDVGIDVVRASLLPADKVSAVSEMRPRPVMMVGDGVNDAPVLAAADVGVAMGARGSTAASETADVVILLDDLSRVVEVVRIARRTVGIAVQSIWVGIALSVALMVVAFFGVIPAIIGATLQELVDVATIVNGLRATTAARGRRSDANRRPATTSGQPVAASRAQARGGPRRGDWSP